MIFTLEPLPASEGDCLLLHWGESGDPKLALIDGGPARTYEDTLLPRLEDIRANRELDRLTLELAMVSHVDNDHVVGVMKLFRRLKSDFQGQTSQFKVKRLWHNTFNDILGDGIDRYYKTLTASVQASVNGAPNPQVTNALKSAFMARHDLAPEEAEEAAEEVSLILAGHDEGRNLRDDFQFLFDQQEIQALNAPFKKAGKPTLITAEMTPAPVTVAGLSWQVLGPAAAEIQALQVDYDKYIQAKGLTATATLAAYADKSVTNLSSIVCLAELQGKTMLFTGDARGDKVLAGLEAAGELAPGGTMAVDVLKVPHHGSGRNLAPDFFKRVRATHYVLSGNGKHGNPDKEVLEWLTAARGKGSDYHLYLTYPVAKTDATRKADFASHHKEWSKAKHSIEPLLDDLRQQGYRFHLHAGSDLLIELGDDAIDW